MTAAATLTDSDLAALNDLIVEHAWLLDHARWHDVAELYAEDGTLTIGPNSLVGREQLLAWADHRATNTARHTLHQCTNVRIEPDEPGSAVGTVTLVLHVVDGTGAPVIEYVGEYRDRYTFGADGTWRFAARSLHPLGPIDLTDGEGNA
ncbi:nuclear transport factor 2 family protein [Mycolicibacterium sp. CBM1]